MGRVTDYLSRVLPRWPDRSRRIAALVLLCVLGHCGFSLAAPGSADIARARRLFGEVTEHEKKEEWDLAIQKLTEAIAIKETPGLRFHLAHALEKKGSLVEAEQEYVRTESLIESGVSAPDVEELLPGALAALRERIPSLTIRAPADAASAIVSLDGVPLEDALDGTPRRLNPGEHRIEASAPGRLPFQATLLLDAGEHRVIEVEMPPVAPSVPPEPVQGAPTKEADGAAGGVSIGEREIVVGVGLALAAGGLGFGIYQTIARQSALDTYEQKARVLDDDSACRRSPSADCKALHRAADDYNRAGTLAVVGYSVAGGAALGAVLTWLLWPDDGAEPGRVAVSPVPGGAQTHVHVQF